MNPAPTRPIDPLDLAGTDWLLTADEIAVRTSVRTFCRDDVAPSRPPDHLPRRHP